VYDENLDRRNLLKRKEELLMQIRLRAFKLAALRYSDDSEVWLKVDNLIIPLIRSVYFERKDCERFIRSYLYVSFLP